MSQFNLKIGPKIKAFRRQLGLQANKLAEDLNISPSYLNLIEGGKRKIDGDLLLKICEKLNIELSQLTSKSDINLENTLSEILLFIILPINIPKYEIGIRNNAVLISFSSKRFNNKYGKIFIILIIPNIKATVPIKDCRDNLKGSRYAAIGGRPE